VSAERSLCHETLAKDFSYRKNDVFTFCVSHITDVPDSGSDLIN